MQVLAEQLRQLGFDVDLSFTQHNVVVINNYEIRVGRYSGKRVRVGIPAQDFPFTAPAGLHFSPHLAPNGAANISQSPLGTDWQYWSRRLQDWKESDRNARHVISYINRVVLNGG
jgi:hypothetical protein